MGFMDGARDCEHRWGGILADEAGRPHRECKRCGLKVWSPEEIERPPARGTVAPGEQAAELARAMRRQHASWEHQASGGAVVSRARPGAEQAGRRGREMAVAGARS